MGSNAYETQDACTSHAAKARKADQYSAWGKQRRTDNMYKLVAIIVRWSEKKISIILIVNRRDS